MRSSRGSIKRAGYSDAKKVAIGSFSTPPFRIAGSLCRAIPIWTSAKAHEIVYLNRLAGNEHMRYAVVIEKSENGYGAYVPDLPGCVAVAETLKETERLIQEAVEFHLEGLREDGVSVPEPSAITHYVEV